jgi:dTDP-4-dehydrorhamnose 3,5-epimerase
MPVLTTAIEGLLVVRSPELDDNRGFFRESYRLSELREALGRDVRLAQGNHSRSARGVLRGFHAEPWDKLVYVVHGTALCVVADVRPESPTFRATETFLLGDLPGVRERLFVSEGLANAFQAISDCDYVNEVSAEFTADGRQGFAWDDATLAIVWPVQPPILSEHDRSLPTLSETFGQRLS